VAWLQKIDNGILVHYYVPVRHRRALRGLHKFHEREPWQEESQPDDIEPVPESQIIERYSVTIKTIFCPSFEETCDAIAMALKAADTIEEHRQAGKLSQGYPFS